MSPFKESYNIHTYTERTKKRCNTTERALPDCVDLQSTRDRRKSTKQQTSKFVAALVTSAMDFCMTDNTKYFVIAFYFFLNEAIMFWFCFLMCALNSMIQLRKVRRFYLFVVALPSGSMRVLYYMHGKKQDGGNQEFIAVCHIHE